MNERDFLTLAASLAAGPTEAAWRTAVSRAYYAVFHVARLLLQDLGFTVPRADPAHAYLTLWLQNCGIPQVEQGGTDLEDLRRLRNRADYDLHYPLPQKVAAAQVVAAGLVLRRLDAARTQPTRTQITDAMRINERDVLKDVTWQKP